MNKSLALMALAAVVLVFPKLVAAVLFLGILGLLLLLAGGAGDGGSGGSSSGSKRSSSSSGPKIRREEFAGPIKNARTGETVGRFRAGRISVEEED